MIGNNVWPDDAREKLLHILPQTYYHFPAQIRGSSAALRRLGEALLHAAALSQCSVHEVEMMAADGESYVVEIRPMSDEQMDASPLPYSTPGIKWD